MAVAQALQPGVAQACEAVRTSRESVSMLASGCLAPAGIMSTSVSMHAMGAAGSPTALRDEIPPHY
jgi:hypothetical protein